MSYSVNSKCGNCKKLYEGCADEAFIKGAVQGIHSANRWETGCPKPHQGGGQIAIKCGNFVSKDETVDARNFDAKVEWLAKELHESGRAAVESGATVAADKFGDTTRKFMGWDEITDNAREGRRIQARYLLKRYEIV